MEDISNLKDFENIHLNTQTLVAPATFWEIILYRNRAKTWRKERKPKKVIDINYWIEPYSFGTLTIEDRKYHKMYSWSFKNEYYKWNTPQKIVCKEWIYKTTHKDEYDRDVYVRWYFLDWKIHNKSFFVLTTLTDRPWLHERTKNWYHYTI